MADTKRYIDLPDLALYKELEEAKFTADLNAGLAKKTDKEVISGNNKALIFNESDGGGAKFEHADGTWSYVGVNNGGKDGITGQLYSVMRENGVSTGTRLNMTNGGFYYTTGKSNAAYSADDELATKGDLKEVDAKDKTVYLKDESSGQAEFSKVYKLYQGADEQDMSKNNFLGQINIPKDMFVQSGELKTVETADVPYPGAVVGDKYIDLILANSDNTHIYIPVKDLITEYDVEHNATQVQLAINNNVISATLVDGGVSESKLDASVVAKLGKADEVLGTAQDTSADITVYGTRAYAEELAGDSTESVDLDDIRALFSV